MFGARIVSDRGEEACVAYVCGKIKKTQCFAYIKDKIWRRIQGWEEKLTSMASKEILIKAVAQVIPTYDMACFALTKSLCDDIGQPVCRFCWSQ
jgi:hypothetical protein